jgi:isopentenyldiphosphate isomerase
VAEIFDIVNEADEVVGRATRDEVHGNPALLHRVVHVLVFSPDGLLYLQRRAPDKDVQPDKWDTSVGGHVDAGEEYLAAAHRELREELGIDLERDNPGAAALESLYKYRHSNSFESELVQTYRLTWAGPIRPDPIEIAEGRFWDPVQIDAEPPGIFTPNFLDELARYRALENRA